MNHYHLSMAGSEFEWSASLSESERKTITKMLASARVNGQCQELIDELTAAVEKGAIRNGAVPWFSGLLNRFKEGTYQQTPQGAQIARRRTRSAPGQRTEPPHPPEPKRTDHASARAHIERMREQLSRKGRR